MNKLSNVLLTSFLAAVTVACGSFAVIAQTGLPKPGAAPSSSLPAVKETKLKNGLTVAVVEKRNVPIVTVQLLFPVGADVESQEEAGLANLTASMLTKGTKTRSATQIAEEIEFLGGVISSGAGWNNSSITVSVTSDKLDQAMAILADVALNPTFPQDELDLLKSQEIDGLTYNLTQPGFLSNYVSSVYSLGEHPADGTLASLNSIGRPQVEGFYKQYFDPNGAVLIFVGDITSARANQYATKLFGGWESRFERREIIVEMDEVPTSTEDVPAKTEFPGRILVVDLPDSGQASVSYVKRIPAGRVNADAKGGQNPQYYPASVLNSLLGGGYSSRLNQEIRIKRGLSYGAGSSFAWRYHDANFSTRTQTKNESAPEVAEIVLAEIRRLAAEESIASAELDPRKSVLTGGFARSIETTGGLVNALADLYTFGIPASEMNSYMQKVEAVSDKQIHAFAGKELFGGDLIIVGDYAVFKDDLAKRFPNAKPTVIQAAQLDITALK